MTQMIYSALSSLICISVLYLIASELIQSDKYKPYVFLVLSTAVVITLIKPLHTILDTEFEFTYSNTTNDGNYRDWFENVLIQADTDETVRQVKSIIANTFPNIEFNVRAHRLSESSTRIYVTVYSDIQADVCNDIRKYISHETGISSENVNIYLQTAQ